MLVMEQQAKEQIIYHTKKRIMWDSYLIKEKLDKANKRLQHEREHRCPDKKYIEILEKQIVFFMSRLHFLHQEERIGRIHKWDLKNGETDKWQKR